MKNVFHYYYYYKRKEHATNKTLSKLYKLYHCCRKRRAEYFKQATKKDAINIRRRKNYREDGGARKEKNKRNSLRQLYGLTLEKFNEMRHEQNYCCAICKLHESEVTKKTLYVDHCHETGKVRGLLCNRCNIILGQFNTVEKLEKAFSFIQMHKG